MCSSAKNVAPNRVYPVTVRTQWADLRRVPLSNQSQAEEEEKTLATIREKSKNCPNCAIAVQWADGCKHVTFSLRRVFPHPGLVRRSDVSQALAEPASAGSATSALILVSAVIVTRIWTHSHSWSL